LGEFTWRPDRSSRHAGAEEVKRLIRGRPRKPLPSVSRFEKYQDGDENFRRAKALEIFMKASPHRPKDDMPGAVSTNLVSTKRDSRGTLARLQLQTSGLRRRMWAFQERTVI
jgi:hypothetical protein